MPTKRAGKQVSNLFPFSLEVVEYKKKINKFRQPPPAITAQQRSAIIVASSSAARHHCTMRYRLPLPRATMPQRRSATTTSLSSMSQQHHR